MPGPPPEEWEFEKICKWSSVKFSCPVKSDSLRPHGLQHTRLPCPSSAPRVYSDSCPSSRWCHPTISSSLVPFSSCFQSFPASGSFPISQFFAWDGQSIGVSVSASVQFSSVAQSCLTLCDPMKSFLNEYSGLISFKIAWLDFLAVQGTLKSLFQHSNSKGSILQRSVFFIVQLSHPYMITGKTIALTRQTFVGKVMSLLFNMLPRLVITFLPRSKHLLISWLQSPSAVILEPPKIEFSTVSIVSSSICHEVMGPDAMILVFWMLIFKPTFLLSSFTFIKRLFSSSLSAIRVVSSGYLRYHLDIWVSAILIPACASSSSAFLMTYSACKLNKQGDNIQPWCTPFPIWNQSVVPCPVLTVASWPAYRFLWMQVILMCS